MSLSSSTLLRTSLFDAHRRLGARMVDFAGWDMPVQYRTGIIAEHAAVRGRCGLFDLSHMGRVFLRGRDALALAQVCATRDVAGLRPGEAGYALLCAADGGILDDVIAYVLGAEEMLFVFNASNRLKDVGVFEATRRARGAVVSIEDRTMETALIGVQGPHAEEALQRICSSPLAVMPGYSFQWAQVLGRRAFVARTGYTGEDGFEVLVEGDHAESVWDALLGDGSHVTACGLGARDTLRTEAGMPLYGHEIDESTNPYEARLGWVVNLAKPDFTGKEALAQIKARGPSRRLVGLQIGEGGVPRPGFPILHAESRAGALTSGTFSPSLKRNIGMGYVPASLAAVGQRLEVEMRGKRVPAEVVALPFVPHRTRPRSPRD